MKTKAGSSDSGLASRPMRRKVPMQARAMTTIDNILQATYLLAQSEGGFQNLTTAKIARKAGISVGSLYQYFSNCESIYLALYEKVSTQCASAVRRDLVKVIHEPLESGVKRLCTQALKLYEENALVLLQLSLDVPAIRPYMNTLMSFDALISASIRTYMELHLGPGNKKWFETRLYVVETAMVNAVQQYALDKPSLVRRDKFINDVIDLIVIYFKQESARDA